MLRYSYIYNLYQTIKCVSALLISFSKIKEKCCVCFSSYTLNVSYGKINSYGKSLSYPIRTYVAGISITTLTRLIKSLKYVTRINNRVTVSFKGVRTTSDSSCLTSYLSDIYVYPVCIYGYGDIYCYSRQ